MDPNFKRLAHERAIFMALARVTEERFLVVEGAMEPAQIIECDDLPRGDCQVPLDAVMDAVMKLRRMASSRARELSRYRLVPVTEADDEQEWTEAAAKAEDASEDGAEEPPKEERAGKGKDRRNDQSAATGGSKRAKPPPPQPKGGSRADTPRTQQPNRRSQ